MASSEHTMKRELGDAEELIQPVFVPIQSGTERTSENPVIERNVETPENKENVESSVCTLKRELDDAEALMSPLFVPTESEPDFHGTSEERVMDENLEANQNAEDKVGDEFEMKVNITDTVASMASSFLPTAAESDFEKTSGVDVMEEDSQASTMAECWLSEASILVKDEPIDCEESWPESIKLEPTSPFSMNTQSDGSAKNSGHGENVKNMANSEHTMKRELGDAEELIQPVFVPIQSGTERNFENPVIEQNVETPENRENVESSVCTLMRELDDAEALMSLLFVRTESEPDFHDTAENPVMDENFEAIQNTEVGDEFEMKMNVTDTVSSTASSFVPTKSESDIEKTSGVDVMEEDSQASTMAEDWLSEAGILVKDEPIDCEESWQESIKLEPTSPFSMNTQSDGSVKNCGHGKKVISKEGNWQPHLDFSPLPCSSRFVSSTESLSEMDGTDSQDHLRRCSFSSSSKTTRSPGIGCQNVLPAASCSNEDPTAGQEKAADTDLWKKQVEEQEPGENQKQTSGQFGDRISSNLEETYSQKETQQFGLLGSSTSDGFFKCSHCGRGFRSKDYLNTHIRIHTGDRPYKCSQCGKSFSQSGNLTRHMRKHTGDRPYKCSQCEKSFTESGNLTRHMRKHTGDRPYKCSQCGKSFIENGHLTSHMRKHTGDRPYRCSQCGKSFTESGSLTNHMRTHSGDRPYKCSQCGKTFAQTSNLTSHMRTHTGDRPYKCSQCGKSFAESGSLTKHLRTHSGDRPYKCPQCAVSFRESSTLTRHLLKHSGNRPYKCFQCGKSFIQNSDLTSHMHIHSGERRYRCSQCGKSFMHCSNLSRHVLKCTGEQPFK